MNALPITKTNENYFLFVQQRVSTFKKINPFDFSRYSDIEFSIDDKKFLMKKITLKEAKV
mgnify:CR=1 FL=1